MYESKDTNIHKPDDIFSKGKTIGHVDKDSKIYRHDGEEMGYVDEDNNVRRPDGIFFRGESVGQIKNEEKAHANDGIIFQGVEWGYVDDNGNIHQKDGIIFRGRVIGKMQGYNKAGALGYYILRFKDLEKNVDQLGQSVRLDENKVKYLGHVRKMLDYVSDADALGDFDMLINKLKRLEEEILNTQAEKRCKKEELCRKAEFLSNSNDWKVTHAALVELQEKWKGIGFAGKEFEDTLWERFRSAQDKFYQYRKVYFEKFNQEQEKNCKKKEALCSEAESLSTSTNWKATSEAMKELQAQWKNISFAGKEYDNVLWCRFKAALDKFYQRRKEYNDSMEQEHQQNRRKKEILCSRAESLSLSTDWKSTSEKLKDLQTQWKETGSTGRKYEDDLWRRFRSAQDRFFERRNSFYEKFKSELNENLRLKEHLCESAESLTSSSNLKSAKEEIKVLQAEWKEIGHVPREYADNLWQRFRKACDEVFERAREEYECKHSEWERKQTEWRSNLQDAIERKHQQIENLSESIAHDNGLVERWQDTINNLYDGGKADEIRDSLENKISDVEDKIRSKENKVSEMQDVIRDIESKLR